MRRPASTVRTCCRWGSSTSCRSPQQLHPVAQVVKNWQVSGIASWMSGRPFTVGGDNGLLQQQGGTQTINVTGDAEPGFGKAGPNEQWYNPAIFSQPGNAWGNTGRNAFRAPSNYNLDASLFRTIPIGSPRSRFVWKPRTCSITRSGAFR